MLPDGRLVAFFSTGKHGQGAGLFIMPIQRPWLAKKISSEVGESLRLSDVMPMLSNFGITVISEEACATCKGTSMVSAVLTSILILFVCLYGVKPDAVERYHW